MEAKAIQLIQHTAVLANAKALDFWHLALFIKKMMDQGLLVSYREKSLLQLTKVKS